MKEKLMSKKGLIPLRALLIILCELSKLLSNYPK